ncbi:hypothetical protein ACFQV2_21800 [Actinokineospora soli]|uniref:Right handed beta helix domain-containing protein n=1 Tax=Actinokineospora soli TaxID=1048753 RepID=A0ABW2TSG8_9PSEU
MRTALLVAALTAAAVVVVAPSASAATAYHVDCAATTGGNGTQSSPWNSLDQVNATTFGPGDQLLFKRGATCTGRLIGTGSGTASAPIRVGAYGTGTARPVINGAGALSAVYLKDVSHWTLNDLRVTNPSGTRAERNGVRVETASADAKAGIVIDGLEVDNVAGWGDKTGTNAAWFSRSSGIMVLGAATAGPINGISIVNNHVHDTGGGGIKISNKPSAYHTSVRIADNRIISAGGDGIVVHGSDAPLVERNRADNLGGGAYPFVAGNFAGMWPINSRNPVFQFNEVTRSYPSIFDSTAWDCDGGIVGTCTYQYNFSAGNAGGFHLGCQTCTSFPNYKAKEVIRYNVSQDDCRAAWVSGSNGPVELHNNTFYCAGNPIDFTLPNGTGATTSIRNNIFVAAHGSFPTAAGVTYDNNLYWGGVTPPSGDTNAVTGDPALAYPGGSGSGFNSVDGYKLRTGSPALGAGAVLAGAGSRDYFGAAVPKADGTVNIGADNGSGVGAHTYPNLKAAFNNTGISKDVNPAIGGFSLSGRSYSSDALAAAGFKTGPVTANGVTFQWTQQYYGFPDNVKAAGQKITLSGSGTAVAFLGAAGYGTQSGTGTVTYTDGTTSTYTLSFTDWWASSPIAGNQVAATLAYHNKAPTTYNNPATGRDEQDVRLFQTSVPITAGKAVASITLPNVGGPLAGAGLHVFAMTVV